MRIEISAGGLRGAVAVVSFQSGMKSYISRTDGMISSFKAVRTATYNLNGGVDRLAEAVRQVSARERGEESRKTGAETVRAKANDFLNLAIRIDQNVADMVKQNREELYGKYPRLNPSIWEGAKKFLSNAWKWLRGAGEAIAAGVERKRKALQDIVKLIKSGIMEFYRLSKEKAKFDIGAFQAKFAFQVLFHPLTPPFARLLFLNLMELNGLALWGVPKLREYAEDDAPTDAYAIKNEHIFGQDNAYRYVYEFYENGELKEQAIVFHEGLPKQPEWRPKQHPEDHSGYDHDYDYDPNSKPTLRNYLDWIKWEFAPLGGIILNQNAPDGTAAYLHYRYGNGTPVWIDFEKAYREDSIVAEDVDARIAFTNEAIRKMIAQGAVPPFSITSELIPNGYPVTKNWQKTIGDYSVWISADVTAADDGSIVVTTTVHELDRYNFNKDQQSLEGERKGIPDEWNGRFEVFNWADSFDTHGEITFVTNLSDDTEVPRLVEPV